MLCPIHNPTSYKIHAVIPFLHAKNTSASQAHCELCAVYSKIVMSEGPVKILCGMFKDGQTNIHNEE
jgi:hypothetical protein